MKSIIFFLLFIINFSLNAQNNCCNFENPKGKINLLSGISIVDDGFTEDYNLFATNERWQYGVIFGVEYLFSANLTLQLAYSINFYMKNKVINGAILQNDIDYSSLNINTLYSFQELLSTRIFEPYLIIGSGLTSIDSKQRPTLNLGGGVRIWFGELLFNNRTRNHKDIALDVKSLGLFNLPVNEYGRQLQHTLGIIYRF